MLAGCSFATWLLPSVSYSRVWASAPWWISQQLPAHFGPPSVLLLGTRVATGRLWVCALVCVCVWFSLESHLWPSCCTTSPSSSCPSFRPLADLCLCGLPLSLSSDPPLQGGHSRPCALSIFRTAETLLRRQWAWWMFLSFRFEGKTLPTRADHNTTADGTVVSDDSSRHGNDTESETQASNVLQKEKRCKTFQFRKEI